MDIDAKPDLGYVRLWACTASLSFVQRVGVFMSSNISSAFEISWVDQEGIEGKYVQLIISTYQ